MNVISFIMSIVCVGLFIIITTSHKSLIFLKNLLGFHPLYGILALSFITILIGLTGFIGASTWRGKFRSVFTLIVSVSLSIFVTVVLLFGNFLKFT